MDKTQSFQNKVMFNNDWDKFLNEEFEQEYMLELTRFIEQERRSGKEIYPEKANVFAALEMTALGQIKAVILGQDPYHGAGQAQGLSFSVPDGVAIPPSLRNIFKELKSDIGIEAPASGNLKSWAEQGVLLLNTVLTVEAEKAGSHQRKGWEVFTDKVIEVINEHAQASVFLLWGKPAQTKQALINKSRHQVLCSAHPSPLSAYRGFFGCQHFSKCNAWLQQQGREPINWQL